MPEPVRDRKPFRLRVEAAQVPAGVRRPFILAALELLSPGTIAALLYSLGPELGGQLFNTDNAIASRTRHRPVLRSGSRRVDRRLK